MHSHTHTLTHALHMYALVCSQEQLVLAQSFFAQLQREYGREPFVKANGEGAAIELACELALTCLRNEDYCTDVPTADSLGGMVL